MREADMKCKVALLSFHDEQVHPFEGRAAASPYLSSRGKAAPTGLHKD
jgi:hypothetical protein